MNFCYMHFEKIKTFKDLKSRFSHNRREHYVASVKNDNKNIIQGLDYDKFIQSEIPFNHRKDAVLAVEFIFVATKEWFDNKTDKQIREWIEKNKLWLNDVYTRRVKSFCVHNDETTCHIHAILSCYHEDTNRLSAKRFLPKSRKSTSELQDHYATYMKEFNLNRGIKGSKGINVRPITNSTQMIQADLYRKEKLQRIGYQRTSISLRKKLDKAEKELDFLKTVAGVLVKRRLPESLELSDFIEIKEMLTDIVNYYELGLLHEKTGFKS